MNTNKAGGNNSGFNDFLIKILARGVVFALQNKPGACSSICSSDNSVTVENNKSNKNEIKTGYNSKDLLRNKCKTMLADALFDYNVIL